MENFQLISSPKELYKKMLQDIDSAKKSIYIETYIYGRDKIGNMFRKALEKKASQGVKVLLLIDAFGSGDFRSKFLKALEKNGIGFKAGVDKEYFRDLIDLGGQVRFFKEIRYVFRIFGQNHERNHRKILVIDDNISYIGSANITASCLTWRELVLRFESSISHHFSASFLNHWDLADKITIKKIKLILHRGFEIIQDVPADTEMLAANKYLKLINNARKDILIETPYFVPPIKIRNALAKAVKRGVNVCILLPYKSDLNLLDLVRNRYIGALHRKGINIFYYPGILHSKLILVDKKFFLLGSSNLDYRSFIHQHEINLFGTDKKIIDALYSFFNSGLDKAKRVNYWEWKKRSSINKILELISSLIDNYL